MATKTAIGMAMINTEIDRTKILSGVWQRIFQVISDNVSDPKSRSIKWVWSAYPDNLLEDLSASQEIKAAYPVIVIPSVDARFDPIGLDWSIKNFTFPFSIEVYSDRSDHLDQIASEIINQMDVQKLNFYNSGLTNVRLESTDPGHYKRSSVKVLFKSLNFTSEVVKS